MAGRCAALERETKHWGGDESFDGLKISRTSLLNIYKAHGVVRRRASFKFNRRLRSEHQQTDEKVRFLRKLLAHMTSGK